MTDWDCNPKDAQELHSNPYEKKAFIGGKDFTLHVDNAGYKYIKWTEDRVKQYKGE